MKKKSLIVSIYILIFTTIFSSCSNQKLSNESDSSKSSRAISSRDINTLENNLTELNWNIVTTQFKGLNYVYTPFFVENNNALFITGGAGVNPGNSILKLVSPLTENNTMTVSTLIKSGPDLKNYNYFRAPRAAKANNEMWVLTEMAGCYTGCDDDKFPKRIGAYYSSDSGASFKFIDFIKVDGKTLIAEWFAHTGLIYNPDGSPEIDEVDLTNNKFITTGEQLNILVSNDGLNYKSFKMNYPYPKDRLIFSSIAKTPFGYHLMSNSNWSEKYYTISVRHLFSKDLIHWIPLESYASLKNPNFYKGIHLSYDSGSNRLWAVSPCGTHNPCSFISWLTPIDFSKLDEFEFDKTIIPVGEFVHYNGKTAMILAYDKINNQMTYKIRFADGRIDSGYTKEMFHLPLSHYRRHGCTHDSICVGDAVLYAGTYGAVIGLYYGSDNLIKFALKFSNGNVDTGFLRSQFSLP
jgi:hypothetical protein